MKSLTVANKNKSLQQQMLNNIATQAIKKQVTPTQRKTFQKIAMEDVEGSERLRMEITEKMQRIGDDRLRKQTIRNIEGEPQQTAQAIAHEYQTSGGEANSLQ